MPETTQVPEPPPNSVLLGAILSDLQAPRLVGPTTDLEAIARRLAAGRRQ